MNRALCPYQVEVRPSLEWFIICSSEVLPQSVVSLSRGSCSRIPGVHITLVRGYCCCLVGITELLTNCYFDQYCNTGSVMATAVFPVDQEQLLVNTKFSPCMINKISRFQVLGGETGKV